MILFETLDELFAASTNPCYYEQIFSPSDLKFQFTLTTFAVSVSYVTTVELINPYTKAVVADISGNFTLGITGSTYTFILNTFAPFMCDCTRFILKVSIPYFQTIYYLGIYQIYSCCANDYKVLFDYLETPPYSQTMPVSLIKSPLRIESWNDCEDKFTGEKFIDNFTKISDFEGRLIQEPRDIEKEMSLNCRVLTVKSMPVFKVEIFTLIPAWKMEEVSFQMQHQNILINGVPYYFSGGKVANRVEDVCENLYYFSFNVQGCERNQMFGCFDECPDVSNVFYYTVPPTGRIIYNENGQYMSSGTREEFFSYLRGIDNTIEVTDLGPVAKVETFGQATSFYVDYVNQSNRFVAHSTAEDATPVIRCPTPIIGTMTVSPSTCVTPVIGTISAVIVPPESPYVIVDDMTFIVVDDDVVSGTPESVNIIPELLNADLLYIQKPDSSYFTAYTFDKSDATLTFTDTTGLAVGDALFIKFSKPF